MSGTRKSGRKRLPTAIKQLHGSRIRYRQHGRRVTHDASREPAGATGVPVMPAYLADDALAVAAWERFAATLTDLKVLTTAHALPLALLAETAADLERMHAEWSAMGRKSVLVTEWRDADHTVRHRIMANPIKRLYRAEKQLALQLAAEFGLTPASASKVITQTGETDPDFAAFLNGPKVVAFPQPATRRR